MVWDEVAPILLGGGIALVSAVGMFTLTAWYDRKQRRQEKNSTDAMSTYHAIQKMIRTLDFIENMARHIDREFADAERSSGLIDPSSLVRPIIGIGARFDIVESNDLVFLSNTDGELAANIYEIQIRALNIDAIVTQYNSMRLEYDVFLENHITRINGPELKADMEGRDALIAEMKVGRLNQLVAGLVVLIEEDRKAVRSVLEEFIKAASTFYKNAIPVRKLEMREA
jgi:hypothetical protein